MKQILKLILGIPFSLILTLFVAVAIAVATFIENNNGIEAARNLVYNAKWFEVILVLWCINLFINIKKYKLWRRKKLGILLFHLSFIVILFGAAITRYFGEEGILHLRENEQKQHYVKNGTIIKLLPFTVLLNDFVVERYPGSNSPSSFISKLTLSDLEGNKILSDEIFMNNVLTYKGYRLYQSGYDPDENGSIIFVNYDVWGTNFTYLGYFLMCLGMIVTLFFGKTRFKYLLNKLNNSKTTVAIILFLFINVYGFSDNIDPEIIVPKKEAAKFGELLVQDNGGRIKPVNTLSNELVRKIYGKTSFKGLSADQVVLSMLCYPEEWRQIPMIKLKNDYIAKKYKIETEYASLSDFYWKDGRGIPYKLAYSVQDAYSKKPSERSKFDNAVIKIDERNNLCYLIYSQAIFRLFPDTTAKNNSWISPVSETNIKDTMKIFVRDILFAYTQLLNKKKYEDAETFRQSIQIFQYKYGKEVIPTSLEKSWEIRYNNFNIFSRLFPYYLMIGFVFLLILFFKTLRQKEIKRSLLFVFIVILSIAFVLQSAGLIARAYISGHAPWSDGYESMIYIAWVSMFIGFLFVRKSAFVLAAATFFTGLSLFVAHLSWLSPEVTNLVPVLKSYWLTIHVAIITASYGFLAVATLLAFVNLLFYITINRKNFEFLLQKIKRISYIIEVCLIVGLFFLTIGTILGAVWGNSSWGRYWAWDPKETWALVSILVYVAVLHLRLIPRLKSLFAFNVATLFAFSSIIMTYLGVNYLLSGLHSYADGESSGLPMWSYSWLAIMIIVSVLAFWRYNFLKKIINERN